MRARNDIITSMKSASLQVGEFRFQWGSRTYVMGILNVTPDSFSGDGLIAQGDPIKTAVLQAKEFVDCGADVLDVGGESTRPGSAPIGANEEIQRVVPVIHAIREAFPGTLISIDTYKAQVVQAAVKAGASIINDIWALRADPDLAAVAAEHHAPVVLMHNRSSPSSVEVRDRLGSAYGGADYQNLIEDVRRELMTSVALAQAAGIDDSNIILDPGIGFGKTREQNLQLINRLDEIRGLGYPVLLGASRKSFIGFTLDLPADDRVEGTAATVAIGIARGADIIRVHDVRAMRRVAKMSDALVRS